MKQILIFLAVIAAGCSRNVATPPAAQAQPSRGCALAAWVMQQKPHSTRTLEAPPPVLRDTVITVNGERQHISIPAGFTMTVFASNVPKCRGLALSPDGVVYAATLDGNVYAFPDHNRDGIADSNVLVTSGLGDPDCVGFYKDSLYVSNDFALYRLIIGPGRAATSKVQLASFPPGGGHFTRNFIFDTAEKKIFVEIGSNGNIDTTDYAQRARIVEMNLDGSGYESYASGLRNAEGMDFDPRTGALWANMNGMDNIFGSGTELTDDNPSEGIYLICKGANYGWPWCYAFRMRNPLMMNLDTSIVETFDGPVAEVEAHSAPLSLHFYRGTKFPAMYHNAIFQCYHGSWDRSPPAPPRITVMWADTDGRNARVTDFVHGFFVLGPGADSNTGRYFGRPVSLIEGADSALYVSDDQAGVIYRIAYTGATSGVSAPHTASGFRIGELIPNPARNAASISITLPQPELVRAELFDLLGHPITTPFSGMLNEGMHSLPLDFHGMMAGVYLLKFSSAEGVVSRRIVVTR